MEDVMKSVSDSSAASVRTACPLFEAEAWRKEPWPRDELGNEIPDECPRCINADVIDEQKNPVWQKVDDTFKREYGHMGDRALAKLIQNFVFDKCKDEGRKEADCPTWSFRGIFEHYMDHIVPFACVVRMKRRKALIRLVDIMEEGQLRMKDDRGKDSIDIPALREYTKLTKLVEGQFEVDSA